jgi:hypothetical protein
MVWRDGPARHLVKTPAGGSIIVLLSIGLEIERQEVSGFFNITFTPTYLLEEVGGLFIPEDSTRKAQRPACLAVTVSVGF